MNISQKVLKELFEYRDGRLYWRIRPSNHIKIGMMAGSYDKKGYRRIKIDKKEYREHQLIFLLHHGYLPKEIDHKDTIRDNNRIENLRECTRRQNQGNQRIRKGGTSKYKGVSWNKRDRKWQVKIRINGRPTYLGNFTDEKQAAESYDRAAIKHFGEFAKINFKEKI